MDKEFVGAEARSRFQTATTPILSPQDLDTYADWIVDELTKIATLAVPKKPHGRPRQQPWWNDKVQSARAPGLDELPAGFLKACGPALTKVLVHLLNSSYRLGYYPARFRKAKVVILRRQGKKPEEYHEAGGWRPISLLSIVGKVLEVAVAARVTAAAESNGSLPELQMGNRANRSTEVALSTLAEVKQYQSPQGFPRVPPMSPILFLIYIAPLYEKLKAAEHTITLGFSDETNTIAYGRTVEETQERLESAWSFCQDWSVESGLKFNPRKSELLHFTRSREAITTAVGLDSTTTISPKESSRFLGVHITRKLRWKTHEKQVQLKLDRQRLALTVLAASTWGCPLREARLLYTQVTKCLRVVTGAYKATPIAIVETESAVPPVHLFLDYIKRRFYDRIEANGMAELTRQACTAVASHLRRRQRRPPYTPLQDRPASDPDGLPPDKILEKEWRERWHKDREKARARRPQRTITAAEHRPSFHSAGKIVRLHQPLMKHESAALIQMRTEKIGLRGFLFSRKVPDVDSPMCDCWE
ncbi:uncharacterized protein CPUR_02999 [Claviceps purpurea 20.1]|uniref:Uncharacterized protein n=1 Tax=Claviceps purpurea (strain 20.1) TaxID=1111077 RepID=M1W0E4_CLAP2|nr:uncharacterized protein CPUR_02999 [Claviceps purpurea 20.1]